MAQTTLGLAGAIERTIRPRSSLGNPDCSSDLVLPPSTERNTADPGPPAMKQQVRRCRCHIVATRTSGFLGSIWMSLAPVQSSPARTRVQLLPPSVVL